MHSHPLNKKSQAVVAHPLIPAKGEEKKKSLLNAFASIRLGFCLVGLVFVCLEDLVQDRNKDNRAGEMAQWLRALTALPEVLSSIPSNHMVDHNHL